MRIRSKPNLEKSVFRSIPVCDASPLWHTSRFGAVMLPRKTVQQLNLRRDLRRLNPIFFIPLNEVLRKSPLLEHTPKPKRIQDLSDKTRVLSVGYPTLTRMAISIRGHLRTVE